ncbi:MAG: helix-turn-helix transcriptional regulator [Bacteroidota bacterium]
MVLNLKRSGKKKGVSQEKLALETGFELSQIGRIERGEINTSISHVAAIAKVLKVNPEALFQF